MHFLLFLLESLDLHWNWTCGLTSIWTIQIQCLKSLGAPWLYTGDLHSSYYATSKNNNCASDVFGCVSDKRVTTYIIFIYTYIFQKLGYVVEMSSFSLCHISLFQKVLVVCFLSCYYYYYTVFLSVIWSADIYHHWESIYVPPRVYITHLWCWLIK